MLDNRNASAYANDHREQLLREAELERLAKKSTRRKNVSARLVIWVGDLLIATGSRLKAVYEIDNAPNVETANSM